MRPTNGLDKMIHLIANYITTHIWFQSYIPFAYFFSYTNCLLYLLIITFSLNMFIKFETKKIDIHQPKKKSNKFFTNKNSKLIFFKHQ